MKNSVLETLVGTAVVVIAAGFLTYLAKASDFGSGGDGYDVIANFQSAEGLNVGTDVRMAGVKIGTVTSMELDRQTYEARTKMVITNDVLIPDDSDVSITTEGLLGGSFVEVSPGGSEFMLAEGDEFMNVQSAISLLNLLMKFASGSDG